MLVGADNHGIDQRVFLLGICSEMGKNAVPAPAFRPAAMASGNDVPRAKTVRQITPRHTGTIPGKDGCDKQTMILRRHANRPRPAWQHILDFFPWIVP
jgi:hypothetical protein